MKDVVEAAATGIVNRLIEEGSAVPDKKHLRSGERWRVLAGQLGVLGAESEYQAGVIRTAELLERCRQLNAPEEYREFQLLLVDEIRSAEARALDARRRLGRSRPPYTIEHTELAGSEPARAFVIWHRRVSQLRGVGDAVAWRMLDFDRGHLAALAGSPGSGFIADKAGFDAELRAFDEVWSEGTPALLGAVTRCIRVGDVIELRQGGPVVREVKRSTGHRRGGGKQSRTRRLTQATLSGQHEPGEVPRVVKVDGPIHHFLGPIGENLKCPTADGFHLTRTYHADFLTFDLASWCDPTLRPKWDEAHEIISERVKQDLKQEWLVSFSMERSDLEDHNAPYSVFPFPPEICAQLMFGYLHIWTHLNLSVTFDALARRGLSVLATVPLHRDWAFVAIDEGLNRVWVPNSTLQRVVHEGLDPRALADLVIAIRDDTLGGRARSEGAPREVLLPTFASERELWR